jgi:hypothetical protein
MSETEVYPPTAAVCGLCCDVCSMFIAAHEDPQRLTLLAGRMGWDVADAHCDGCRGERRTPYCRSCDLFACAERRGHAFCGECADYPCTELQDFQRERPHRAELYQNLDRIAQAGVERWLAETKDRYTCPACGTLNSCYDLKCRKCGHEPSCAFVSAHKALIAETLRQM